MSGQQPHAGSVARKPFDEDLTDWDQETYLKLISTDLSEEQRGRLRTPALVVPRQDSVLAVHWHPEFIPIDLIRERIDATFPNHTHELIIPTQHNELVSFDDYTGVEIDCFSPSFNRKVQLLAHFENDRLKDADVFKAMLAHTFRYRSRQLFEFMDSIIDPALSDRLDHAAAASNADPELVEFVQVHTRKLRMLFDHNESITPQAAIKNKLLSHYIDAQQDRYDLHLVQQAANLLKAVKRIVKAEFKLEYFYETRAVIEEVRSLGGGIVIPHPEQFWPILLAEYDVDGYEVWNPQSREYTEFLINVVTRQNRTHRLGGRPILTFMGDDCHMGEKARKPQHQDPEKANREIGVQTAWDDLAIRKSLIIANASRRTIIEEYKARLASG